jgi:HD-like signal output (HDOD) protein
MQRALIVVQPSELGPMKQAMSTGLVSIAAEYVTTPGDAEERLDSGSYDLLITTIQDRHDPHASLIHRCDLQHRDTARLVISDDPKVRDRVPAHLAIQHRLTGRDLQSGIQGALRWHGRLHHVKLAELVAGSRKLPSIPDVYLAVEKELNGPDPSMHRVGEIIQGDPALATTVLRVVNSATFGLRREVGDIIQAAAMLGEKTISSLVLAASMYSTKAIDGKLVTRMWRDALSVGNLARRFAADAGLGRSDVEESHLAGLIHDIGDIVLLQNWPAEFSAIDVKNRERSEVETFGATHADIGGFVATLWDLPAGVVDAITHHHTPSAGLHTEFISPVTAVHVARAYVDCGGDITKAVFDLDHLRTTGAGPKVESWFALARQAHDEAA